MLDSGPRVSPSNGEKDPPSRLPEEGILLGYSLEQRHRTAPIGFTYGTDEARNDARKSDSPTLDPILHVGGGHLMTIAPTGGGKGVGCIVPSLLRYAGPVIVIDPKGENYAVTAARRRALGQEVVVLDPLGITGAPETGALNPLDLIDPASDQSIDDAASLASLLSGGVEREDPRNMFWYQRGAQLLTGLIQFVAADLPRERRNLSEVRRLLNLPADDFSALARTQMANSSDPDVRQVAGTLANPAAEMIGSIMGMSQNSLGFLRGPLLHESTASSTFSLDAITAGDPLSIYIVIPPDKLESHRNLLRLWIGVLMSGLMRRRAPVPRPTLLILDEAAQLGPLDQLRQAITLMRGYGVQTWSFWQDVSQLENLYPRDWETMYNNCRVHQSFGFTTLKGAEDACALLGFHDPIEALQLDADEMILSVSGDEAVIAQKPNYLTDPAFQGLFASNPFYSKTSEEPPTPQRPKRLYIRPTFPRLGEGQVIDEVSREVAGSEDEEDESDRLLDIEALFESSGLATEDDPVEPVTGSSLLDPLPDVEVDWPSGVLEFLTLLVDQLGGSWNPVTSQIRGVSPSFYPNCHIVEIIDASHDPSRLLVFKRHANLRVFRGDAPEFDRLNREFTPRLTDENVREYVRLRLHFGGGTRRIRIADTADRLRFWIGRRGDQLEEVSRLLEPLESVREASGGWTVTGTAVFEGALARVRIAVEEDGTFRVVETETLIPLGGADGYPAVDLDGGKLPEVLGERLEAIHGWWEALEGSDRRALFSDLSPGDLDRAKRSDIILRRTLACYPHWDLVRIANPDWPQKHFVVHRAGQAIPVLTGTSEWLHTIFHGIHDAGPELDSPEQAQEYLRFFTWLISSPSKYWVLLDRPDHLPLTDEPTMAPKAWKELEEAWTPLSSVPTSDQDRTSVLWRFKGTLLHARQVVRAEFEISQDGMVEMTEAEDLVDDAGVDDSMLGRILALPPLGRLG